MKQPGRQNRLATDEPHWGVPCGPMRCISKSWKTFVGFASCARCAAHCAWDSRQRGSSSGTCQKLIVACAEAVAGLPSKRTKRNSASCSQYQSDDKCVRLRQRALTLPQRLLDREVVGHIGEGAHVAPPSSTWGRCAPPGSGPTAFGASTPRAAQAARPAAACWHSAT